MKTRWIALVVILLSSFHANAQKQFESQSLFWFRYYNQAQITNKLTWHNEIDERVHSKAPHQFQLFFHTHLHYRLSKTMDVAAGGNFNLTNSTINTSLAVPEWRPWQEINYFAFTKKSWSLQIRYRLDERFIHNNNKVEFQDGYHFNLRHRFRIMAIVPIASWNENRNLMLKLSDEVMINTGDVVRAFDQNRIYVSFELKLNNQWSVETGYLNMIQPKTDAIYFERNIIRTTLYHRLNLVRKKSINDTHK